MLRDWIKWIAGCSFHTRIRFGFFSVNGTPITPPLPIGFKIGTFHAYDKRWPRKPWMN